MVLQRSIASGVGSMPGEDFAETLRQVLGDLTDLPFVPELPARGVHAGMTGRSLAVVSELGFDLQPAGWRLTDAPGVDHRRARSLLAQDLDSLEEHALAAGLLESPGRLKLQLAGPWTLAATVERPRGDRLLADRGARRELAEAFALGVSEHLAEVARRLPGTRLVLQVDEPGLPAVLAAAVPTSSGFGRHRAVHPPEATEALTWVVEAAAVAGASVVAHCCARAVPLDLLAAAGFDGISLDLDQVGAEELDGLGSAIESGTQIFLGVVPSVENEQVPDVAAVLRRVERTLEMLGFGIEEVASQIVLTPTCGLAGASPSYARTALTLVRESAARLAGD